MKKTLRISILAILLISIFASISVFAGCGHSHYTNYSNSGKWASATTTSPDGYTVSAKVYGNYSLANDYTSYSFTGAKDTDIGAAYSKWIYGYSGSTTFTSVNNLWSCAC